MTGVSVAGLPPAEVGRVEDSTGPRVMAMDGQTAPATILLYISLHSHYLRQVVLELGGVRSDPALAGSDGRQVTSSVYGEARAGM